MHWLPFGFGFSIFNVEFVVGFFSSASGLHTHTERERYTHSNRVQRQCQLNHMRACCRMIITYIHTYIQTYKRTDRHNKNSTDTISKERHAHTHTHSTYSTQHPSTRICIPEQCRPCKCSHVSTVWNTHNERSCQIFRFGRPGRTSPRKSWTRRTGCACVCVCA